MLTWLSRSTLFRHPYVNNCIRATQLSTDPLSSAPTFSRRGLEQVEYIKSAVENNNLDWPVIKTKVLSLQGHVNQKNYEGVMLKMLVNGKKVDAALSFADHLKTSPEELSLGSTNGLLDLYCRISEIRKLSKEEKAFILNTHKKLYEKYKALDFSTSEKLICALCVIDEYEKALKVLEDIHVTSVPSHKAYSVIIGTLFNNNKKKKAIEIINKSIENKRPLQYLAFNGWINFIFRKYKERNIILKYLEEIFAHISRNYVVLDEKTATKLKDSFESLGWNAGITRIKKNNGQCVYCKDTLDCLQIKDEEFHLLQQNVKEKLIVGSDLFLKTSPEELKTFSNFIEKTAPYDVVIDSLNVCYAIGKDRSPANRINMLCNVVEYFQERNKKILLLGRKHMLKWGNRSMEKLKLNTCSFFTDNLSEDDPFFITAAILSGPNTDIVSKDLLRGHKFLLQNEHLRYIFRRWQWQHQWMVYTNADKGFKIQAPLSFTPCAQKKNGRWHIPYEREDVQKTFGTVNDGTPDLSSWLCIKPRIII